jgi:hypothetical protein
VSLLVNTITKRFGPVTALGGVSFDVADTFGRRLGVT